MGPKIIFQNESRLPKVIFALHDENWKSNTRSPAYKKCIITEKVAVRRIMKGKLPGEMGH